MLQTKFQLEERTNPGAWRPYHTVYDDQSRRMIAHLGFSTCRRGSRRIYLSTALGVTLDRIRAIKYSAGPASPGHLCAPGDI